MMRLRGRSLDELRVRGGQALHARMERVWDRFALPLPHPRPSRPPRPSPFFLGAGIDPARIARAIAHEDAQTYVRLAERSEALAAGSIALLGHERLPAGNPPHWHREALSGVEAPRRHWSRIDHLDTNLVGDHKLLWELNRQQYLLAPAFCWLIEREQRRLDLIESHLESWLSANPPRQGVNWVSSLEVAYRAITWCWLLWLLHEAPWKPGLRERLLAALAAHAQHIERYLSTYFSPNTHLTGEALGLFYLGTVLDGTRHARRWRSKGAAILESALERQVYSDGVYFEQATQYQRYTAEIYLHYLLLGGATGWNVSARVRERLAGLFAVLRAVSSGAGRMPLLGDDDGGLLLPLDHRGPEDLRALLLAGAVALQQPALASGAAPVTYAYWLNGIEATDRLRQAGSASPATLDVYFAHGGLAVLRDGWEQRAAVALIDAGPHGALSCGHSHADALGMTLALGPLEIFIDRGTLTYTGPERNEFRATLSHNTLEIDGTSAVLPGAPFKWLPGIPERARGVVYACARLSSFFGLATGHLAGARPSRHCRRVLHQRGGAWVVHDRGIRSGARSGVLRWQLAPRLLATLVTPQSVALRTSGGVAVAALYLRGAAPVRIVTRDVSPRLGQRVAAGCLELQLDAELEALTIIVPAGADGSLVRFEADASDGTVSWSDAAGRQRVSSGRPGQPPHLPPGVVCNADLLWCTEAAGTAEPGALLAAMPTFTPSVPDGVPVTAEATVEAGRMIALARQGGRWTPLDLEEPRCG
ncbi:MAG: alginate lyase family protein [Gammaproteobacteria bacterium]|nr:alginate lyase family protein [Gammaproteobacteria bacterium]